MLAVAEGSIVSGMTALHTRDTVADTADRCAPALVTDGHIMLLGVATGSEPRLHPHTTHQALPRSTPSLRAIAASFAHIFG